MRLLSALCTLALAAALGLSSGCGKKDDGGKPTVAFVTNQVASCTAQALRHRQYSVGHSARAPAFIGLFNYMRALSKPLGNLSVAVNRDHRS